MIKFKIQNLELRYCFGCDFLFNNELIFYKNNIMTHILMCWELPVNYAYALCLSRDGRNKICSKLSSNT